MDFSHPFFKIERSAAKRKETIAYWKAYVYDKTIELREAERIAEDLLEADLKQGGQEEKSGDDYAALKYEIKYAVEKVKEVKARHISALITAEFCISQTEFYDVAAEVNISELQVQVIMLKIFKDFKDGNDIAVTKFFKEEAEKLRPVLPKRRAPTWLA